jgi:hypothetical protein
MHLMDYQASFAALHSLFSKRGHELNPTGESESRHKNLLLFDK